MSGTASGRNPSRGLIDLDAWRYFESCSPGRIPALLLFGLAAAAQSLLLLPVLLLIRHAVDSVIPQRQIGLLIEIGAAIFALRAIGALGALWLRAAHVRVLKRAAGAKDGARGIHPDGPEEILRRISRRDRDKHKTNKSE